MHNVGHGVPQDFALAHKWLGSAAEAGDPVAQFAFGGMYFHGHGVSPDSGVALSWYRTAAEQGVIRAQTALGGMYYFGIGTSASDDESFKWYMRAAKQGDPVSQCMVGQMTALGRATQVDRVEALMWLTLSNSKVDEPKARRSCEAMRDSLVRDLSEEERAEAVRRADVWQPAIENEAIDQ